MPHICRSPAVSVGGLGRYRAAEPSVLLGFAPSKDSTTSAAIRGAEQPSLSTRLRVDAHRRRRYDRRAGRWSWRALDASSTPVFSEAEPPRIQYRHQDRLAHPDRVRIPQPRPSHRSRTPRPRPPTATPRPKLTHRYSRRAPYVPLWAVYSPESLMDPVSLFRSTSYRAQVTFRSPSAQPSASGVIGKRSRRDVSYDEPT